MSEHIDTDGIFEEEPDRSDVPPEMERHVRAYIETARKVMMEQGPVAFGWIPPSKPDLEYLVVRLDSRYDSAPQLTELLNKGWRIGEPPMTHKNFTILILCKEKESKPDDAKRES